jgi:hypothetical protein
MIGAMPAPDPLSNPYAPPASPLAEAGTHGASFPSYDAERRSVALVVLLSVVTLGIYTVVWYVRRAPFLDSLSADKKVGALPWVLLSLFVVSFAVGFAHAPEGIVRLTQLANGIVNLILAFRVAHILRSDFARTGRLVNVSGAGVFFLGCLYLQHVINVAASTPAHRLPPRDPA